jgi:hypothetical protein
LSTTRDKDSGFSLRLNPPPPPPVNNFLQFLIVSVKQVQSNLS